MTLPRDPGAPPATPLRVSTRWTILKFDGHAVELTRKAWLLPWGRTTRFALDSLLVLDIPRGRSRDNAPRERNFLVLHRELLTLLA
ncbi:hypothetical protein HLK59_13645 [Streptomyces sp. S3(2020)]|uniref:hypothetical protein n=1 Tax=Streptomyces sp. S3(2020) TaxID=2732044 RepID=UPI00148952DA|nr:hypothetical protein [Streptomyces sp. S3(2020)]NNN31389.1 hypothetical protein [Streptomyces sp. S3(2020)]